MEQENMNQNPAQTIQPAITPVFKKSKIILWLAWIYTILYSWVFLTDIFKLHVVKFLYGNLMDISAIITFLASLLIIFTKKRLLYRVSIAVLLIYIAGFIILIKLISGIDWS